MVGGASRDRVRLAAALLDRGERLLPARPDADVEARRVEPHVGAHDPREEDVPDLVVDDVGPLDPALLHEHAPEPQPGGHGRHLSRVVRLHAADRDERVAPLRQRLGGQVLELAHLVPAVGEPGVHVLPLRPDLDLAAEVLGQPLEPVHGRGPEEERHAVEALQAHRPGGYIRVRSVHGRGGRYLRLPLALTACVRARDSLSFAKSKIVISACCSSTQRIPTRSGWPRSLRRIPMIDPASSDGGRG